MSFNVPQTEKKRVVIVGGGFGGLKLANKLRKSNFQVVLIDRNNYHQFPPLIYQIASSGIEPSSISFPFRKIFQNCKDFYFRMAEVRSIFPEHKIIQTSIGKVKYDYLILAAGTTTNFFGNKHVEEVAIPMKNVSEAMGLQNALLENLERALTCASERERMELLNVVIVMGTLEVSKLFVSANRMLDQNYTWVNGMMVGVYRDGEKVVQVMKGANDHLISKVLEELPAKADELLDICAHLVTAKPITPGVYDVITDPSISGLIAHEAFGHGVEMDMFVKDRALAKEYVGQYVASPIVNMKDGAASYHSVASYFFDDDGVLAGDTQIIKDGILVTGISDLSSATALGTAPTGNGRRESSRRKAYSRMTNTFFEPGKDKLEDMIASIDHGYLLCQPDNGMEDPKNWGIQCTAQYGIEIVDGKLTENWVSPVVLSGYVPDLLKSITMVSDDLELEGAGYCGKGYKEWVRVSDGGPALKAKVKLG